jgi:hypothetical protein
MLQKRTVIVLGAGASRHCELPTGKELLDEVNRLCNSSIRGFYDALPDPNLTYEQNRYRESDAGTLGRVIESSPHLSIDALLARLPKFIEVGKIAIAYALMPKENRQKLTDLTRRSDSWYAYLFNRMLTKDIESFGKNPLTIVTFNYDRSLEAYIRICLGTSFEGGDMSKYEQAIESIPIIHLHGDLGSIADNPYGEYTPQFAKYPELVRHAASRIKIISEIDDAANDGAFKKARAAIQEAQQLIFLGFGYHSENVARLGTSCSDRVEIRGTTFGLTQAEINVAEALINKHFWCKDIAIALDRNGCKILDYLRQTELLSPQY